MNLMLSRNTSASTCPNLPSLTLEFLALTGDLFYFQIRILHFWERQSSSHPEGQRTISKLLRGPGNPNTCASLTCWPQLCSPGQSHETSCRQHSQGIWWCAAKGHTAQVCMAAFCFSVKSQLCA